MRNPHITGLDHILLAMPPGGEEQARAFYGGLLGMEEVLKPASLAQRGGCWFSAAGVTLHLGVEKEFMPARKAHPCLRVNDLEALRSGLETAGVQIIPDDALPGVRRFYAYDPFGNRIEFLQDGDKIHPGHRPGETFSLDRLDKQ
jgi:catechol 2,3-dioxygenase-like lactoylglutathione lyase family enzyme